MLQRLQGFAIAAALSAAAIFLSAKSTRAETNTVRVMTFNIHHAEGQDGVVNVQRIADVINSQRADLVGLQEVDRGTTRVQGRDLPSELAQLTGMTCVFSNNLSYQGGEYGNAILSRFPVKARDHRLLQRVGTSEQRGWLRALVNIRGRDVALWNTHLDYRTDDSERVLAVSDFATWLESESAPVILCGDFNDIPGSQVHSMMKTNWVDSWEVIGQGNGYTIPVNAPARRIDYVWVSKFAPARLIRASVPDTSASDHLPVLVELQFTNRVRSPAVFQFCFDEGSGSNVVDSISALSGSFANQVPPWSSDSPSRRSKDFAIPFDSTFRAIVPDPARVVRCNTNNGDYTLEAWVKLSTNSIPQSRMILFQYEGDPGFSFSITANRTLHTTTFHKNDLTSSASVPNDSDWHHVAAVHYDKSRFEFYVDAVLSDTIIYTNGPGARSNPAITIGSAGAQANPFIGLLDRIRFSNEALVPEQFDFPAYPGPLRPELTATRQTNSLVLAWPSAVKDFVLEESTDPINTAWRILTHQTVGETNRAATLLDNTSRFFRLRKVEQ